MPVHTLLAIDIPKWFGDAINEKQHGFFWKGQSDAQKNHCAIEWAKVCHSIKLGGLDVRDTNLVAAAPLAQVALAAPRQLSQKPRPPSRFGSASKCSLSSPTLAARLSAINGCSTIF